MTGLFMPGGNRHAGLFINLWVDREHFPRYIEKFEGAENAGRGCPGDK